MKYLKAITMLPLSFLLLMLLALPAMAETHYIDGDLSDWGVNLQDAYNGVNTGWEPVGHPNVDWIAENNIDPKQAITNTPGYPDWTGYKSTGYHMQKNGLMTIPVDFAETDMYYGSTRYLQPSGGEPYDIEALYFDDDSQNAYIAIVTSMDQSGYTEPPNEGGRFVEAGDIALDLDRNSNTGEYGYEYGIITHSTDDTKIGQIIYNPKWSLPQSSIGFSGNAPSRCELGPNSIIVGKASFIYKKSSIKETVDYGSKGNKDTYNNIIEVSIPRSAIGSPSPNTLSNIHITIGCGNDVIELEPVKYKSNIPEFPSIVLPVAAIMGVMFIFGNRKKE
jgi:hypothetical protein